MHRHHISYRLNIVVAVPGWYHWLIHVPASLGLSGTAWWTGTTGWGCVRYQNKRAKSIGLRWLLGYPNPIQMAMNLFAWLLWGHGWALCAGVAIALWIF
ncbi:MAG: hypothetical protein AAGA75_17505 [Cyanobacteria bacterium P01_E01_bin.6]